MMKKNYIIPVEEVFAINTQNLLADSNISSTLGKQRGESASALVKEDAGFEGTSGGDMWDKEW